MGPGRGADHDGVHGGVGPDRFLGHHLRADAGGQRLGGRGDGVDDVSHAAFVMLGDVAGMDVADAACAEKGDVEDGHGGRDGSVELGGGYSAGWAAAVAKTCGAAYAGSGRVTCRAGSRVWRISAGMISR